MWRSRSARGSDSSVVCAYALRSGVVLPPLGERAVVGIFVAGSERGLGAAAIEHVVRTVCLRVLYSRLYIMSALDTFALGASAHATGRWRQPMAMAMAYGYAYGSL